VVGSVRAGGRPAATVVAVACFALLPWAAAGSEAGGVSPAAAGTVLVRVRAGAAPVRAAEVSAAGVSAATDARGEARLELPAGERELLVERDGFAPATVRVAVPAGGSVEAVVQLREQRFEDTVTVVAATRSGTMVEDQAIRVEALPQEEIEENSTLAPGNLSTLLNEIGGLRVQAASPALGGANLRLQGLPGRYTTILTDELPLYGDQPDAFALLQVPPLDLAQAEVIKGTASALYGGGGLGGLVNLVSRRPADGEPELLVSQSLHGGTDAVGFLPGKLGGGWGYTLLGAADRQRERDLDGDGWADLPGYRRGVLRPRLFWDDGAGRSLFATVGGTAEHRQGGTVAGALTPDGSAFAETLDTRRLDGGVVGRFLLGRDRLVSLHASYARAGRDHRFGDVRERDVRRFGSAELSLSGSDRGHTWVLGTALVHQSYRSLDLAGFDSTSTAPALFVQDEYSPVHRFALSASVRADFDRPWGTFVDPRVSALVRPGGGWSLRLSAGSGYSAPLPILDETEAVGLSRVLPLRGLRAERARSASFDAGWTRGPFEIDETLFAARVQGALVLRPAAGEPGRFEIVNAPSPTEAYGSQFLVRYRRGPLQLIATHTYLHSTEADPAGPGRRETPLTPRHAAELAALYEEESRGRLGVEVSYTGRQALEVDPYRHRSAPYVEVSALGELRLGEARLFLNATNLTGVRQTGFDPLLLPERAPDGRWTTDLWAPLEGRSLNVGVRVEF
jgi:outer membrane receptor for ferrienterochelin and colicins